MAFTLVQVANAVASGTTTSLVATFPANITAGNFIVMGWQMPSSGGTVSSIQDGPGDTFTQTIGSTAWTDGTYGGAWTTNSLGGSKTVTLNYSSTSQTPTIVAAEFSGVSTVSPLDGSISYTGTSEIPSTGNITTTNANDLLIAFDVGAKTLSVESPFTVATSNVTSWNTYLMYDVVSTTGTHSWTGSQASSGAWGTWLMGFKNPQTIVSGDVAVPFPLAPTEPFPELNPTAFNIPYSNIVPVNTAVAQVGANLTLTGGTQAIATIQDVSVAQVGASLTLTGGTQSVATVNNVSISQVGAVLTFAGGTQSVSTVNDVAIAQSHATLTATGGTQVVATVNNVSISQVGATLTATGGTQSVVATAADSIAYDSSAAGVLVNPGTSQTWSHTCGIGSNRLLLVGLFGNITTDAITGVTYGGVAMTRIAMTQVPTDRFVYLYYLIAPATGTNNVVISANASIAIEGLSASYIGVNQTYPIDSSTTNTGTSGTSLTTAINTLIANDWIFTVGKTVSSTPTSGTLATRRQEANDIMIADSNGAVALSGSQNVTFNWSVTNDSAAILAAFSPASAISVTITQVGATLTFSGGTQAVATVNDVAISQTHATLTFTGGTQVVTASGVTVSNHFLSSLGVGS